MENVILKVLIVDDESELRNSIKSIFENSFETSTSKSLKPIMGPKL